MGEHGRQRGGVRNPDRAAVDVDQARRRQARQRARHRLQLQGQEVAQLGAGHAEHELAIAEAQRSVSRRQVQQERSDALFGAERAQREHPAPVVADRAGQHRGHVSQQAWRAAQFREGKLPRFAGVERERIAGMDRHVEGVDPQQVAAQVEAGDLLAAVLAQDAGLEQARVNQEERMAGLAGAEQDLLALEATTLQGQGRQVGLQVRGHGVSERGRPGATCRASGCANGFGHDGVLVGDEDQATRCGAGRDLNPVTVCNIL
nr:hypothetical protein [Lysobacter spongiae]